MLVPCTKNNNLHSLQKESSNHMTSHEILKESVDKKVTKICHTLGVIWVTLAFATMQSIKLSFIIDE